MKQKLRVFLTLLLCAVASVGWGQDLSEINLTQSTSSIEFTIFSGAGSYNKEEPESFSVTGNDGNSYSWTKFYCMAGSSTNSLQMHAGDAYAISPTIKSSRGFTVNVTFNATAKGNLKLQIGEEDAVTGTGIGTTGTNNDVTITATTTSTETSFKLSNIKSGSNSAAVYVTKIEIVSTAEQTDPSITAENVDIDYNATSGVIEYSINNPDDNGELTAATTSDWLILGTVGTTVPFTCSVNEAKSEREATVTLTYTYGENQTVTKNVTVTQAGNPNVVDKISDITTAGTYAVQGTIVAKSQRGFVVGDGTGYVYYYNQNYDQDRYNIGDMVKLSGSVVVYGGVFEFNSSTTITSVTESNYVAEEPTVLTGAQMDSRVASTTPAQLSNYVQFEGTLSVSDTHYNITIIDGASTAKGSISYPLNTDFTSLNGKTVKVTGYYVGVSSSTYYNIMLGSIEEVEDATPIIDANDVALAYDDTEGEITYTIGNVVEGGELTALVTSGHWLTLGEIGASSITFTCEANTGAERSATVTLTYTYNTNETVTKDVSITQAAYVAPIDGVEYVKVTSSNDITDGQYLIVYEEGSVAFNGGLETLDAVGNTIEVTLDNSKIAATEATVAAEFTIDMTAGTLKSASGQYIGKTANSNGIDSSAETEYTNTFSFDEDGNATIVSSGGAYLRYNSASNQTRFRYYKSESYNNQKAIQLYKKVETVTASITAAGYATFANAKAVDFTGTGVKVMTAQYANGKITYTEVTSKQVPAGAAVILQGTEGTYYATVIAEAADLQNNDLQVNLNGNITSDGTYYCLANKSNGVGFYKVANGTIVKQGKAYLKIPAGAKDFFSINDETDGIGQIEMGQTSNAEIYNLSGQRVNKAQKGIYIVNGKKVVIK